MTGFDYTVLDDLADQTAAAVLAVWLLRPEFEDEAEWRRLIVAALVLAILQAESWGRAYGDQARPVDGVALLPTDGLARRPAPEDFTQRSGRAPRPESALDLLAHERELTDRLERAVQTLADEPDLARVERLARDEPIQAAQRGFQDGLRLQEKPVQGYRRGINPDCCELCFWLWKEGFVYDLDLPMHRHTGCRCVPVPTTDPYGKWQLSADDQALLDDLYRKYVTDKRSTAA